MLDRIKNKITTTTGLTAMIVTLLSLFGFDADPTTVSVVLSAVVALLGLLSKD